MNTYFAPAERKDEKELIAEIEIVSNSPVMSGLLHSISGLLVILDEYRQIVALNDSFIHLLGIDDPAQVLGLRPGEALQCIHADTEPGGCGTSKMCSTCGAAISIVSSLGQDKTVERICALSVKRNGKEVHIALLVRSHPINIDKKRFLLLFIQDITQQQQRAALERTFFHDVNNMLGTLIMVSELLAKENPSEYARSIHQVALRLNKEVIIQRCLSQSESCEYQPVWDKFSITQIFKELQLIFTNHPVAQEKHITFPKNYPDIWIRTDISLLQRVLTNMILNALEATKTNGTVKIWFDYDDIFFTFNVWNAQEIPSEITGRIFQRNFSTKEQNGRGVGTYSMKLFGEKVLGGQVSFTTSKEQGTTFQFAIPI